MDARDRERRLAELVSEIDVLQAELATCLRTLLGVVAEYPLQTDAARTSAELPILDDQTYSVHWRGATCQLGCTLSFKLLQRLARRPRFSISCDQLRDDVWRESQCCDSTIRSAVRYLRRQLRAAHMDDLAAAIQSRKRQYVLSL